MTSSTSAAEAARRAIPSLTPGPPPTIGTTVSPGWAEALSHHAGRRAEPHPASVQDQLGQADQVRFGQLLDDGPEPGQP
jgi:hypothetical protein